MHNNSHALAKKEIGLLAYIASIASPLTSVPQAWDIYSHRSAGSVSLAFWLLGIFLSMIWLSYGITRKEKPIIISNTLWLIFGIFIASEIILFR